MIVNIECLKTLLPGVQCIECSSGNLYFRISEKVSGSVQKIDLICDYCERSGLEPVKSHKYIILPHYLTVCLTFSKLNFMVIFGNNLISREKVWRTIK